MKTSTIGIGIAALFLLSRKSSRGNGQIEAPPNEEWFEVPGYGPTPGGMLSQLGYHLIQQVGGWIHAADLQAAGFTYMNGSWNPPRHNASAYLDLASSIVTSLGTMAATQYGERIYRR